MKVSKQQPGLSEAGALLAFFFFLPRHGVIIKRAATLNLSLCPQPHSFVGGGGVVKGKVFVQIGKW